MLGPVRKINFFLEQPMASAAAAVARVGGGGGGTFHAAFICPKDSRSNAFLMFNPGSHKTLFLVPGGHVTALGDDEGDYGRGTFDTYSTSPKHRSSSSTMVRQISPELLETPRSRESIRLLQTRRILKFVIADDLLRQRW